ncbi:MAG: LysM peptidoglycan-binding domain-containing protein [Bacteroidales bacterium]|jgi:LysM repeat protein|nr:LysM peptidoglycan-binding domain-containing protein [Bacteroidales bacterium]MCB9028883.1 LysM peptidoglycan-binding domain-containing protein [Bacteroidales bacterium]NLD64000.1 LysM peptidoglycan-binding domain-containing protein [Bacteroidales bacterium]HNT92719.1 LysM peptidoglycan-binding domain-containing protein [Bacteroidales bacterium]HOO67276.1 LysM peptidoglycan-binding domain-containing protein [Bacteroidales bacterium]
MKEKKSLFLIRRAAVMLITAALSLPVTVLAQEQPVRVDISTEKIVSEGKVYYMHSVLKGQTLYSIARAYSVTVELLIRENGITDNSIKEGQVLRIPAAVVAQGQAARSTGIQTREQAGGQADSTPGSATPARPAVQPIPSPEQQDERFIYHRVRRGETLGTIANEYGITVRELKRANKGLLFPHEGDYLMIPRRRVSSRHQPRIKEEPVIEAPADTIPADTLLIEDEPEVFTIPAERTVIDRLHGSVKVAVLFPFFISENNARSYIDSAGLDSQGNRIYREVTRSSSYIYDGSLPFLEAYEGILIAVDSLRTLGLTVEMEVHDTGADTLGIYRLMHSGTLENVDLIIGPVFSYHLEQLAGWAAERDIPLVSPVSLRDRNIVENKPTLYRVFPSETVVREIMAGELRNHPDSRIVFLYADSAMYDPATTDLWNRIARTLNDSTATDSARLTSHYYTGVSPGRNVHGHVASIESLLLPDRENIIVLASSNSSVVSTVFSALHGLKRRYDIKVLGYPEIRGLETIDLKYYYDLELLIPLDSYVDYESPASMAFSSRFLKKFKTEPMAESFAWRGFDIGWYFIGGLATGGKEFLRDPGIFNPALLCLEPDFRRDNRQDGYENRGIFMMHYHKDMTIEITRPWPPPVFEEQNVPEPMRFIFSGSSEHNQER